MTDEKNTSTDYTAIDSAPMVEGVAVVVAPPHAVRVIAPSDMPTGYQFTVDVNGERMVVSVPEGGVKEGQEFKATVVTNDATGSTEGHNIPVGRWRDDTLDCCANGPCHPLICLAWWCGPLALGQVMTRNKLSWTGVPLNGRNPVWSAFKVVAVAYLLVQVIDLSITYGISGYLQPTYDADSQTYVNSNVPGWAAALEQVRQFLGAAFGFFVLFLTFRTRGHIRAKYSIPEKSCHGCEDFCCSFFCGPCTICQMGRHTADYDKYQASCCTETGLVSTAPEVV